MGSHWLFLELNLRPAIMSSISILILSSVTEFKQKHNADMIVPVSCQNWFLFFLFYLLFVLSFLKQYLSPNGCDQEFVFRLFTVIYTIWKGKFDKMSLVTENLHLNSEPAQDVMSARPLLLGRPKITSGGGFYEIAWHDWVWFPMFYRPLVLRIKKKSWFKLIDDEALHWAWVIFEVSVMALSTYPS